MQEVKSPKKPFLYYCLIVATIMVLLNSLVFPNVLKHSVKEVDYNTFMKMTENKEIGKVNIDSGEIIFTDKSEEKMYKTGVMDDPGLVDRLYDSGADFSSKITEEMSPILYFLLSYILPIAIFIMLGRWLSKKMMSKMNGGANPMNSMMFGGGKSNAKIYVKSSNGIKISSLPFKSGSSTGILRSNRPGRSSAGSSESGWLVAARITTPFVPSNPSISVKS